MAEVITDKTPTQAPADVVVEKKPEETPKVEVKPTGLDNLTVDQLKEIYKRTPEIFTEAGIVQKKDEKPKEEAKKEELKPDTQSAAPAYDGQEIKLPTDVAVNRAVVDAYLLDAKANGMSAKQVQAQIDFQTKMAREALASQPKPKTPQEIDTENVAVLKSDKDFGGANYEANMEIARQGAMKHAGSAMLEKLKTSDPVLVKHFWELGKKDSEDTTRGAPNRTGNETDDAEKATRDAQRARYPNTKFEI